MLNNLRKKINFLLRDRNSILYKPYKIVFIRWFLAILIAIYIFIWRKSSKVRVEFSEEFLEHCKTGEPFLLSAWHGRAFASLILIPLVDKKYVKHVLVSKNEDGKLIGLCVNLIGGKAIYSSTNKISMDDMKTMIRASKLKNNMTFITPDGPIGPRMNASYGVANVAYISNLKVFPSAVSCRRSWILKTWDRLMIPSPFFNETLVKIGKPITYDANVTDKIEAMELLRLKIEEETNIAFWEVDDFFGYERIEKGNRARNSFAVKIKKGKEDS